VCAMKQSPIYFAAGGIQKLNMIKHRVKDWA